MANQWQIAAGSYAILNGTSGPASHDYLVLVAPDGSVVSELHGLATEPTTLEIKPVGNDAGSVNGALHQAAIDVS